jgi:hypothetical protein
MFGSTGFNLPPGYTANGPNVVDNRFVGGPQQVAEPATVALVGVGVAALVRRARVRRSK